MIPGRMLHGIAARICSARSLERVIEPTIADLQREYLHCATMSPLRRVHARAAGYLAVLRVLGVCMVDLSDVRNDERRGIRRMLASSCVLTVAVTILLTMPPLSINPDLKGWYPLLTVVPQALPLAIPIGVVFAIALSLSTRVTPRMTKAILAVACVASLLSFGTLAWLMPAGNQAFRELAAAIESKESAQVTPRKGPNEMTFAELRREVNTLEAVGQQRQARLYSWTFHLRFTLPLAVIAVAIFMLVVPVQHRVVRGLLAFAVCFVYWALLYVGEVGVGRDYVAPLIGAWLPNIVFLTIAAMIVASSRFVDRSASVIETPHRH